MTNKDKMIAAFLVSVGVFSATQAAQYVGSLSSKEKCALVSVVKGSKANVLLCNSVTNLSGTENDNGNKTT
jgi:hypothetical protein